MLAINRLSEHFSAAAFSIQQSRSFDGVCIVVSGCMVAVADAIMRKIATDEPSVACSQLMGKTIYDQQLGHPGFGVSVGSFATQVQPHHVSVFLCAACIA